jgi:hypothetical protein
MPEQHESSTQQQQLLHLQHPVHFRKPTVEVPLCYYYYYYYYYYYCCQGMFMTHNINTPLDGWVPNISSRKAIPQKAFTGSKSYLLKNKLQLHLQRWVKNVLHCMISSKIIHNKPWSRRATLPFIALVVLLPLPSLEAVAPLPPKISTGCPPSPPHPPPCHSFKASP